MVHISMKYTSLDAGNARTVFENELVAMNFVTYILQTRGVFLLRNR